jgi:hypothetical protein
MGSKVKCKLCSCEGVDGTVLRRDHLDGYAYAASTLLEHGVKLPARLLEHFVKQQKGSDNG